MLENTKQVENLLLHYNANLFPKIKTKKRNIVAVGKNSAITIEVFFNKVYQFITNLPEDILIYMPIRKGFRLLSKELINEGVRVKTQKIIPGSFTNSKTAYFIKDKNILYLNETYHQKIIREHYETGGEPYYLRIMGRGSEKELGNNYLYYNHRSVKSHLIFFYLFLVIKRNYSLSFKEYAAKIKKEEILFAKFNKTKIPEFITTSLV